MATVIAALVAAPAFAKAPKAPKAPNPAPKQVPARAHPDDVYAGQKYLGRDPDPFIRGQLLRAQNWPDK